MMVKFGPVLALKVAEMGGVLGFMKETGVMIAEKPLVPVEVLAGIRAPEVVLSHRGRHDFLDRWAEGLTVMGSRGGHVWGIRAGVEPEPSFVASLDLLTPLILSHPAGTFTLAESDVLEPEIELDFAEDPLRSELTKPGSPAKDYEKGEPKL